MTIMIITTIATTIMATEPQTGNHHHATGVANAKIERMVSDHLVESSTIK